MRWLAQYSTRRGGILPLIVRTTNCNLEGAEWPTQPRAPPTPSMELAHRRALSLLVDQ